MKPRLRFILLFLLELLARAVLPTPVRHRQRMNFLALLFHTRLHDLRTFLRIYYNSHFMWWFSHYAMRHGADAHHWGEGGAAWMERWKEQT
jgi:hypothetical protein